MKWISGLAVLFVGCVANVSSPPGPDGDRATDLADRDDSYGDRRADDYDDREDADDEEWSYGGDGDADTDGDVDGDADSDADGDFDPNCDAAVCDPYEQCGCARGEACVFGQDDQPACWPEGTGQEWDSCAETGCAAGLMCIADYRQDTACYALCDDAHACPRGEECIVPIANASGELLTNVCAISGCSLVAGDCPGGQACIAYGADTTICTPPGDTRIDATCLYAEECVAGASCIGWDGENDAHCLAHCDANYGGSCPGGHECVPLNANGEGVCAIL